MLVRDRRFNDLRLGFLCKIAFTVEVTLELTVRMTLVAAEHELAFDLTHVLQSGLGELVLLELFLMFSELLHFCLDFLSSVLQLLLLLDFSTVYALLEEIAEALQLFDFFFHIELGFLLHRLGGSVLNFLLKLVEESYALENEGEVELTSSVALSPRSISVCNLRTCLAIGSLFDQSSSGVVNHRASSLFAY